MNEIVHRHTALPANFGENLMKGIADTRATMATGGGDHGKLLLRLLKSGQFVIGQNNEPVQAGSEWAVNIASLARGWVCWGEGELLGQIMASVQAERLPQPAPVDGVPFKEQFSMELTCVSEGENEGQLVIYKNNSGGFKEGFEKLLADIANRYGIDRQYFWPVINLRQSSYPHKKYGQTWKPHFDVVAWTDELGVFSPDSDAAEVAEEPVAVAAPKRGRPAKAPEEAPQPTQQAHVGQRRRPVAR